MKHRTAFVGLCVLLLTGCVNYLSSYDFTKVYDAARQIDTKYGTLFHNEQLAITMVSADNIDPMLADMAALQKKINNSRQTDDRKIIEQFLEARMNMLEAERSFEIAAQIGLPGLATDGYKCSEMQSIAKSRIYLRDSLGQAEYALQIMDLVLQEPVPQQLIGVNKERPKFYDSPFRDISAELRAQKEALLNCLKQAGMSEADLNKRYGNPLMDNQTNTAK